MRRYYNTNHFDELNDETMSALFDFADQHPEKCVRIVMDEDYAFLDNCGDEQEILQALVLIENSDNSISRFDFTAGDEEHCLYLAADPEKFLAISMGGYEKIGEEKTKRMESLLAIFKKESSIVFVSYEASMNRTGIHELPEVERTPCLFDQLVKMFDSFRFDIRLEWDDEQ